MADGRVDAWLVHLAEGVRDGDRAPGDMFSSRSVPDSPYRALIDATERNVRLMLVDGAPVAGDVAAMRAAGAATAIARVRSATVATRRASRPARVRYRTQSLQRRTHANRAKR
jgi:hypothetical protein